LLEAQCSNILSKKEMVVIDDYDDGEERDRECEMWNEKRKNSKVSEYSMKE